MRPKDNKEIKALLLRYTSGKCTEEEKAWVESWYTRNDHGLPPRLAAEAMERDLSGILRQLHPQEGLRRIPSWFRVAAVLVLLAAAGGLFFYFSMRSSQPFTLAETAPAGGDIAPGENKAILTLDDGRRVILDSVSGGVIAHKLGVSIKKIAGGQILYTQQPRELEVSAPAYHLISTPRGGQYRLTLSDGTRVWLNAASSLRYPASFGRTARKVELRGEAYFEVARTGTPFLVETRGQVVEVLGTHFNINAYDDEPVVKTTLLEGAVRVRAANYGKEQTVVLSSPGHQSIRAPRGLSLIRVDPKVAIAWKNGLFRFQNTDIRQVMRQVSRWYDVEVEFSGESPDIHLWGEVYRNANASQVLEILAYFDLEYKILKNKGNRKIIVSYQRQ